MPQPGVSGAHSPRRTDPKGSEPPRIVAFDPVGEITVSDRRVVARSEPDRPQPEREASERARSARVASERARAASQRARWERAEAAERFAASFGLEHGVEPVEVEGRRTITITGQGAARVIAPRARTPASGRGLRRAGQRRHERPGFRGDRAALWAVGLGLLLVLVAAASAHASTLAVLAAR